MHTLLLCKQYFKTLIINIYFKLNMKKVQKSYGFVFSSDDSQSLDQSMDESIEMDDSYANKSMLFEKN